MTAWPQLLELLSAASGRKDTDACRFSVKPLPRSQLGWIGCSGTAGAAFLLRVADDGDRPLAVALPAVRIRHGVRVLIDDGIVQSEESVSLFECLDRDTASVELFVRCVGSIVAASTDPLTSGGLADAIERLLELFRDVAHATESEILGLWGELVLLTHCQDPIVMAGRWRQSSGSHFDFGTDMERLDVKATVSAVRHHELSSDQAQPPAGAVAAFVSLMTERVSDGTSVRDLWQRLLDLAPEHADRIDANCVGSLGRDWLIAQEHSFDLTKALATLRIYPAAGVPRLGRLPTGVIRARFVSDFGRGTPWQERAPSNDGPIASAIECARLHAHPLT